MDYNSAAAAYAAHRKIVRGVLASLLTKNLLAKDSTVLEVGCGTGNYLQGIHSLTGCTSWGIDPSTNMLAQARQQGLCPVFQLGHAEQLDFPDRMFDLVFSVDVIHHVTGKDKYFQEANRVLKPGGWVCTVTDSEWIIRNRAPLSIYFPETVDAELSRYPKIEDLIKIMHEDRFTQIDQEMVEEKSELVDIQIYRDKAFSALHNLSDEAFQRGIARLEADVQKGPIQRISRYILLWGRKDTK